MTVNVPSCAAFFMAVLFVFRSVPCILRNGFVLVIIPWERNLTVNVPSCSTFFMAVLFVFRSVPCILRNGFVLVIIPWERIGNYTLRKKHDSKCPKLYCFLYGGSLCVQRLFSIGQKSLAIPKCDLFSGNFGICHFVWFWLCMPRDIWLTWVLNVLVEWKVGKGWGSITRIIGTCLMLHGWLIFSVFNCQSSAES